MAKLIEQESTTPNQITAGTHIKGDIEATGNIRFDGTIEGRIKTKGKVVIGSSGLVKGEIICKHSEVEGKIEGKINVEELLSLKATSTIMGDIVAKRLAIEPGARFTGNCKMGSDTSIGSSNVEQAHTTLQEESKKLK
jgi:cytoskeletal protein CcmA (bactofilin family)